MPTLSLLPVALLLLARLGDLAEPELEYGAPWSPLTLHPVPAAKPSRTTDPLQGRNFLGLEQRPTSLERMKLQDQHSFGAGPTHTVWLARYAAVPIRSPDGSDSAVVTLTLAFDADSRDLLCAFTDPASRWPQSRAGLQEIGARGSLDCQFSRAHYDSLQSTVTDVLRVVWDAFHVDPSLAGQIILRPRFVTRDHPARKVVDETHPWLHQGEGPIVPAFLPSNIWVVEVLGTFIFRRRDTLYTSLVAHFHDQERIFPFASPLP